MWYLSFCVRLVALNTVFSSSFYPAENMKVSQFYSWIINYILKRHSSLGGHPSQFHVLTVVDCPAVNMGVR